VTSRISAILYVYNSEKKLMLNEKNHGFDDDYDYYVIYDDDNDNNNNINEFKVY